MILYLIDDYNIDYNLFEKFNKQKDVTFLYSETLNLQMLDVADVVLLDLNMPIGGFEVLRKIRKITYKPVYIYTTSYHDADKEMAEALGANGFITKCATRDMEQSVEGIIQRVKDERHST